MSAGKGDKWRKGTDFKKYYNSPFWVKKDMKKEKPIYFLGDVHGFWGELMDIFYDNDIKNCIIICVGDFGVGFREDELSSLNHLNAICKERNIDLYSIRGNHDDPSKFDGKTIWLSNVKLLKDYSVLDVNDIKILLVGGAISIDRKWRQRNLNYWEDEPFVYKQDKIVNCDVLVTHSAPLNVGPESFKQKRYDLFRQDYREDEGLDKDCLKERLLIEKLERDCECKTHYCGHFHEHWSVDNGDCRCIILAELELFEHRK